MSVLFGCVAATGESLSGFVHSPRTCMESLLVSGTTGLALVIGR